METWTHRGYSIDPDLYLVVDSDSDHAFWRSHLDEHYPRARKVVHNLQSKEPSEEFDRIIKTAKAMNYAHIIFLTDEDASPDPVIKVKRLQQKLTSLRKKDRGLAQRVQVFGVRRCLEAWFLADQAAIRKALPRARYRCKRKTDNLCDPKRESAQLYRKQFGENYSWSEADFARRMACRVDFDRAGNWSDSLSSFWRAKRTIFANWR